MAKKRLKLARLNLREVKILQAMSHGGDFAWLDAEDIASWTLPKMSMRLRPEPSADEISETTAELEALLSRHFIDKNEQGQYRENEYGVWSEMAWRYHYGGALPRTAKEVFGVENPVLREGNALMCEISEEALNRAFWIVEDDNAAHQEYLAELAAKRGRERDEPQS